VWVEILRLARQRAPFPGYFSPSRFVRSPLRRCRSIMTTCSANFFHCFAKSRYISRMFSLAAAKAARWHSTAFRRQASACLAHSRPQANKGAWAAFPGFGERADAECPPANVSAPDLLKLVRTGGSRLGAFSVVMPGAVMRSTPRVVIIFAGVVHSSQCRTGHDEHQRC
jgi:hypothetical protein